MSLTAIFLLAGIGVLVVLALRVPAAGGLLTDLTRARIEAALASMPPYLCFKEQA
jgi:hypothetical protein